MVLVLSHADVERLLPMEDCIDVMAETLAALARGELFQPLRSVVRPPDASGFFGLMPAHRHGEDAAFALKALTIVPGNPSRGLDSHQGAVLLSNGETGELEAVVNASAITAIRTAAVSAVATRALARDDARTLAIVGAGVQARTHIQALASVRAFDHATIASRTREHAELLAADADVAFPIETVDAAEDAVRAADVIVTATSSTEPVLRREWIADGAHINAVGAAVPTARELDSATVAASSLFVDRRESAENESGDYLIPLRENAIRPGHIRGELGQVLIGAVPGRTSDDELTIFKSLGIAVEDLAAAEYAVRRAREAGAGTEVEF
jgi:ornithine cyclodeaminase/alanine dehydrogenase-like protein (mu-crystallin family)